jgi:hypothetical protein
MSSSDSEYAAFPAKVRDSQKGAKNYKSTLWTNRHPETALALRVRRVALTIQPSNPQP